MHEELIITSYTVEVLEVMLGCSVCWRPCTLEAVEAYAMCWRPWTVCSVCCALFAGVAGGDALRMLGAVEVVLMLRVISISRNVG